MPYTPAGDNESDNPCSCCCCCCTGVTHRECAAALQQVGGLVLSGRRVEAPACIAAYSLGLGGAAVPREPAGRSRGEIVQQKLSYVDSQL